MIFISHNNKDKTRIEPIAIKLKKMYGESRVFYDSWSIQPGEEIIGKMNEGLEDCKFFFLFLSNNSVNSAFVRLEWHTALMKKLTNDSKFIPVLLEDCDIPIILQQIKYIDYHHDGPEVTTKQIIDMIEDKNTFVPTKKFSNAVAYFVNNNGRFEGRVEALYHMEPHASLLIAVKNSTNEIEVDVKGLSLPTRKQDSAEVMPNYRANIINISRMDPITKDFPFRFEIRKIGSGDIVIEGIFLRKGEESYKEIPIKFEGV